MQMQHVGANIYCWGAAEQDRLLQDGVRSWVTEATTQRLADRFWYCRYDARGPHLFLQFATSAQRLEALSQFLKLKIGNYLAHSSNSVELTREELEKRHHACRGRTMSIADREQGLAENNSFVLFPHAANAYPWSLADGISENESFFQYLSDLSIWAIEQIDGSSMETSIRWLAAVDRALLRCCPEPQAYWHYHAATLLAPEEQNWRSWAARIEPRIPSTLSENNRRIFSSIWNGYALETALTFDVMGLVSLIFERGDAGFERRLRLLREINHSLLGQLGLLCKFEIPMVMYAWMRNIVGN
jgi:hypothetical protein